MFLETLVKQIVARIKRKKKKCSLKLKDCRLIFQTPLSLFKAAILLLGENEVLCMEMFPNLKNLVYIFIFEHSHW